MVHDRVLGVSGSVKDLCSWLAARYFGGKLAAGHSAGHDDVGEQQIERLTTLYIFECRPPILGGDRPLAEAVQLRDDEAAYQRIVLHHHDGFAGALHRGPDPGHRGIGTAVGYR
jgi:hypothetical protein